MRINRSLIVLPEGYNQQESKPLGIIVLVVLAIAILLIVYVYWTDGPNSSQCHRKPSRVPSDTTIVANLAKEQANNP